MKLENNTSFDAQAIPGGGPGEQLILTIIVKGTFEFKADGSTVPAAKQIPIAFADEMSEVGETRFESDLAPFKPRADVVLVGKAYAPHNAPTAAVDVTLRVGSLKKTLRVFGDRSWESGGFFSGPTPTTATPFAQMELCYAKAYGGVDSASGAACLENPIGKGCIAETAKKKSIEGRALPNIEDPKALITKVEDRPLPVGFGVVGKGWQPRVKYLGTFDQKWQSERAPRMPEDCSYEFYNVAPRDQQVEGYLRGGELIELINLTPEGRLEGCVPNPSLQVQVGFNRAPRLEKVEMKLDTLYLMPDDKCLTATWRGICFVSDALASEVERVLVSL